MNFRQSEDKVDMSSINNIAGNKGTKLNYDISKVPSRVKINLITSVFELSAFIDAIYSDMQLIANLESKVIAQALQTGGSLIEQTSIQSDYLMQRLDGIEKHKLSYYDSFSVEDFDALLSYLEPYEKFGAMHMTFVTACACIRAFLYSGYRIKEVEQVDVKGAYIRLKFKRDELNTVGYMYLYKRKENRLHIVIMPSQSSELYEKRDDNSYKRNELDKMVEDMQIINSLNAFINWWVSGIYYSGL